MNRDIQIKTKPIKFNKELGKQAMDWGIKTLRVYEIWKKTQGEGVKVAVLDTGIIDHPDLKVNIKGGINFTTSNPKDYVDRQGHGTHVAGIIAAEDNAIGVIGVAPKAEIYAVKVLGDQGHGSFDMIVKGIDWAVDNKMDIISMSLGSSASSTQIHEAVKRAYKKNITVVAAAGNDGDEYDDNDMGYPARYPETIAVGSINKYMKRSWFSSDGEELDIMAPGEEIYSTYLKNEYAILSGTSMATPFITGILALLISEHRKSKSKKTPIDTPEQIREHLIRTADDAGEIGKDNFYGYGIVSPTKLMEGINIKALYA
ncbi:MAG: S8 family peptidase [Candidatus Brocadiae bacterium]|nr:S8 family peptidase [Candidatus Brocadiia bacterium]